jgi:hypothetical protein
MAAILLVAIFFTLMHSITRQTKLDSEARNKRVRIDVSTTMLTILE